MHELSICASIARIATEHAGGAPVTQVHVRVGHLRQVVPDTLVRSWETVVDGTPLAGARLLLEQVPVTVECRACGARTELSAPVFRCGACGSIDTTTVCGDELLVTALDLLAPTPVASRPSGTE